MIVFLSIVAGCLILLLVSYLITRKITKSGTGSASYRETLARLEAEQQLAESAFRANTSSQLSQNLRHMAFQPVTTIGDASAMSETFLRDEITPALQPLSVEEYHRVLAPLHGENVPEVHYLHGDLLFSVRERNEGLLIVEFAPDASMRIAALRDARPDLSRPLPLPELTMWGTGAAVTANDGYMLPSEAEFEAFENALDGMAALDDYVMANMDTPGWTESGRARFDEWFRGNVRTWG